VSAQRVWHDTATTQTPAARRQRRGTAFEICGAGGSDATPAPHAAAPLFIPGVDVAGAVVALRSPAGIRRRCPSSPDVGAHGARRRSEAAGVAVDAQRSPTPGAHRHRRRGPPAPRHLGQSPRAPHRRQRVGAGPIHRAASPPAPQGAHAVVSFSAGEGLCRRRTQRSSLPSPSTSAPPMGGTTSARAGPAVSLRSQPIAAVVGALARRVGRPRQPRRLHRRRKPHLWPCRFWGVLSWRTRHAHDVVLDDEVGAPLPSRRRCVCDIPSEGDVDALARPVGSPHVVAAFWVSPNVGDDGSAAIAVAHGCVARHARGRRCPRPRAMARGARGLHACAAAVA